MVNIIDRYIVKRVLYTFVFVVLIITAVVVVVDISEKIDGFNEHHVPLIHILGYYRDFSFWIIGLVSPLMVFITVVFVTSQMASRTEIIALFSGGMSFGRLLAPYFVASVVIAGFHFALNGWVIPKANRSQVNFQIEYLKKQYAMEYANIRMQLTPDVYLYLHSYNRDINTGYQFSLEHFNHRRLIEKLTAESIQWDSAKAKWTLHHWRRRPIDTIFYNSYRPPPAALMEGQQLDTTLAITPEDFRAVSQEYATMTLDELGRHIVKLHFRGASGVEAFEMERHLRYSSPFVIFVLVFLGVTVSSKKSRGGTGFQVALGFMLSFVLIIFFIVSRALAEAGSLPPLLAAWLPGLSFTAITLALYRYIHR